MSEVVAPNAVCPAAGARWFRPSWLAVVATLAAAGWFVYAPALDGGFIWDDTDFILENPLNRDAGGLWKIWATFTAADYWPVTYSAFWLEWRLWGSAVRGYHLVNLALHVAAGGLLAAILHHLAVRGWWIVAALFVVHPVNVECVAWMAQQKTLLATTLLFASALAYLRARSRPGVWNGGDTAALAAFVLALLAKTSVVAYPCALLGWEWLHRRLDRVALARTAPFFAASLIGGALTIACNAFHETGTVHDKDLAERFAGAFAAAWFYLGKALVPNELCFVYPRWRIDPGSVVGWVPAAAWAAALAAVAALPQAFGRPLATGLAWYLIMLAPATGIVDIYFLSYAPVADHYQYQSLPGVLAAVVHVAALTFSQLAAHLPVTAPWWRFTGAAACAAATITLATAARTRAFAYVDAETLWQDTLRRNPRCELAYNNLGAIHRDRLENEQALACYREVIRLQGQKAATAVAETNLRGLSALLAYRAGRLREAADELDLLLTADHFPHRHLLPESIAALYSLRGKLASLAGEEATAARCFAASLRVLPVGNAEASAFGRLAGDRAATAGDDGAFYAACSQVAAEFPDTHAAARAHHEAGLVARRRGDGETAAKHFQVAERIEPHATDTLVAHAEVLADLGRCDNALDVCARVLQIEPDRADAVALMRRLSEARTPTPAPKNQE